MIPHLNAILASEVDRSGRPSWDKLRCIRRERREADESLARFRRLLGRPPGGVGGSEDWQPRRAPHKLDSEQGVPSSWRFVPGPAMPGAHGAQHTVSVQITGYAGPSSVAANAAGSHRRCSVWYGPTRLAETGNGGAKPRLMDEKRQSVPATNSPALDSDHPFGVSFQLLPAPTAIIRDETGESRRIFPFPTVASSVTEHVQYLEQYRCYGRSLVLAAVDLLHEAPPKQHLLPAAASALNEWLGAMAILAYRLADHRRLVSRLADMADVPPLLAGQQEAWLAFRYENLSPSDEGIRNHIRTAARMAGLHTAFKWSRLESTEAQNTWRFVDLLAGRLHQQQTAIPAPLRRVVIAYRQGVARQMEQREALETAANAILATAHRHHPPPWTQQAEAEGDVAFPAASAAAIAVFRHPHHGPLPAVLQTCRQQAVAGGHVLAAKNRNERHTSPGLRLCGRRNSV